MGRNYFLVLVAVLWILSGTGCALVKNQMDANDQTRLQQLLAEKRPVVSQCYDQFVKDNPEQASGQVSLRVDRNPDGSLYDARLVSGFPGSQPLVDCLAAEIREWTLNPYYNRGSITLTWDFERQP